MKYNYAQNVTHKYFYTQPLKMMGNLLQNHYIAVNTRVS